MPLHVRPAATFRIQLCPPSAHRKPWHRAHCGDGQVQRCACHQCEDVRVQRESECQATGSVLQGFGGRLLPLRTQRGGEASRAACCRCCSLGWPPCAASCPRLLEAPTLDSCRPWWVLKSQPDHLSISRRVWHPQTSPLCQATRGPRHVAPGPLGPRRLRKPGRLELACLYNQDCEVGGAQHGTLLSEKGLSIAVTQGFRPFPLVLVS